MAASAMKMHAVQPLRATRDGFKPKVNTRAMEDGGIRLGKRTLRASQAVLAYSSKMVYTLHLQIAIKPFILPQTQRRLLGYQ